jgi:hypothetical protein
VTTERLQPLLLAAVLAGLGLWASLRPAARGVEPEPIPRSAARPWMADCLPGVGIKTRDRVADALRAGRWEGVPARARAVARRWFVDG